MKVSIITVCFNSVRTIRDTVESVLSQSHSEIEHIIIDGGSTDGTLGILSEYRGLVAKIISEPDEGIYDAMNKGIEVATGDIIGVLNSDDFFSSRDSIAAVVREFSNYQDADVVFGDLVFVSSDDLHKIRRFYSSRGFRPWKLRFGYMPPHPATYVRKAVYDQFGLYKRGYQIAADYEINIRWLVVNRLRFRRVDKVLVCMRTGGVSTSGFRSSVLLNREIIRACSDNGLYTNWLFLIPKIPFKFLELLRRPRPRAFS
jgi:glycosyltransferase involved in cell wall biosynthesis